MAPNLYDVASPADGQPRAAWDTAVDRMLRSQQGVLLDTFDGATDDAKLTAALSYQAAATVKPAIILGNREYTFSQTRTPFSGMRIRGSGYTGFQNIEQGASLASTKVKLNVGSGSSSWLVGNSTVYSVQIADIAMTALAGGQFLDWPLGAGNTLYASSFGNLQFYGFQHVFGRPGEAAAVTLNSWYGDWNIVGVGGQQISVRGSDNWFTPNVLNIGWRNAPADTYLARFENVAKSFVRGWYMTCYNANSRAILVTGSASSQGGLFVSDSVIEGQNKDEWAAGALIKVQGGSATFTNIALNFAMGGASMATPYMGDSADIMVEGGSARFQNLDINKATGRAETIPILKVTGGRASIKDVWGMPGGGAWSALPLAQAAGGTLFNDATVRTA